MHIEVILQLNCDCKTLRQGIKLFYTYLNIQNLYSSMHCTR